MTRCPTNGSIPGRLALATLLAAAPALCVSEDLGRQLPGAAEFELCGSCHGTHGQGTKALEAPRIAGLDAAYVVRQLADFREGRRGRIDDGSPAGQMAAIARSLDAKTAERVAAYVAALPEVPTETTLDGDASMGAKLFDQCTACHGRHAEGARDTGAPRLAGMSDWYLIRQIAAFRSGKRGAGSSSPFVIAMQAVAKSLEDDPSTRNVIEYAVAQRPIGEGAVTAGAADHAQIKLRTDCPPSFEKRSNGRCYFVSLYQLYNADPGQGGLRAPLPPLHDGFTPAQADLGRYLFFDPLLSRDHTMSCAHCHQPALGFTDGRGRSIGHSGVVLRRGAPTLWNVGFLTRYFWDGHAGSLQEQAEGPLFSSDEMGATRDTLLHDLAANAQYPRLFAMAYARPASASITLQEVTAALAAFESTLISLNSRYDRYAHGDTQALTPVEIDGLNVFRGFVARCSQCHVPPLFASSEVAVVGAPPVSGMSYDVGAGAFHPVAALRGAFKIPTLRNIALTAPYFQAGQLATLNDVVAFYNDTRGHAVPGLGLQVHWHVHMDHPELSRADAQALVAFLKTLTDESLSPQVPLRVPSGLPMDPLAASLARSAP